MERRNSIEYTMGVLAILSILLVAVETEIDFFREWLIGIYTIDLIICIIFAWDFVYRYRHSSDKSRFWKWHWYEILAMVPAFVLYLVTDFPIISTGFRALRLIRIIMVIARTTRFFVIAGHFIRRSRLISLLAITLITVFTGAFLVLFLEKGTASAQINNFSDAVWWSLSTVTTVGYGDIVPNTLSGRIVGMVIMVAGIAIMTTLISQLSATIVESRLLGSMSDSDFKLKMKIHLKNSIDGVEKLSDEEMDVLIKNIHSLRRLK